MCYYSYRLANKFFLMKQRIKCIFTRLQDSITQSSNRARSVSTLLKIPVLIAHPTPGIYLALKKHLASGLINTFLTHFPSFLFYLYIFSILSNF